MVGVDWSTLACMTLFPRSFSRRPLAALATATIMSIGSVPVASADAIDRALAALPAGQITCDQVQQYWQGQADYDSKVAQARTIAMFDSRGPQILSALARVDEAAVRCGVKAGAAVAAPGAATTASGAPAAQAAGAPVFELIPGAPIAQTISLGSLATIQVPNLWQLFINWLATLNIRF